MSDDQLADERAFRLKRLLDLPGVSDADYMLASRSARRLEQPLRLTIFGTDTEYAINLLNLLIGQAVVSPALKRARIQFLHSEVPYARLQFRDGTQKRIEGRDFRRLFDENPSRMRIYVDLPVLKRVSMLLSVDRNPKALCADAEKTLGSADIALWTDGEVTDQMLDVWQQMPETLRDHSYLVVPHRADLSPWSSIEQEFVDILRVAPRHAQAAKSGPDGVDKEAFSLAGGTKIVKAIKSEIEVLVNSARDAAELVLMRYAKELEASENDEAKDRQTDYLVSDEVEKQTPEPVIENDDAPAPGLAENVMLGKVASRSRLLSNQADNPHEDYGAPAGVHPPKNMPVRTSRPISKLGSKPRPRRVSRPAATPWSMDL